MTIKPALGQIWKVIFIPTTDCDWKNKTYQELENSYNEFQIHEIVYYDTQSKLIKFKIISINNHPCYTIGQILTVSFDYYYFPNKKLLAFSLQDYLDSLKTTSSSQISSSGMSCAKCKDFNLYGQVNQSDGIYQCWSCRQ